MPSLETANVGKAVAARVGTNIREVRTRLGLTQAQLAAPEFSISYISAIERGKIRPSLKALSILAKRLDVPLTFLLEGSPAGAAEARAQLAAPEFSISYISAIERGKIRPSLKALSILAKRLDVPLTFLLEGSPAGAAEARAVGYSPADSGPDQRIDVELLQANVLIHQHAFKEAEQLLAAIQPERITTDQAYRLFLLRGQIHLGVNEFQ